MKFYSELLHGKRFWSNLIFFIFSFVLVAAVYIINTCIIKPRLGQIDSFFEFFVVNYFNDFWAGFLIAILLNFLLVVTKKQYVVNKLFYVILWLFESFVWEIVRPFILMIINPFNKTPSMLFGDVIVYGCGTLFAYSTLALLNVVIVRRNRKNERT